MVNKKSARMVENKKSMRGEEQPVHQRLHNIHQERMQKQVQKMMQQTIDLRAGRNREMQRNKSELNFNTAKSRERDGRPIEDLLYQDAKRRQEMQ